MRLKSVLSFSLLIALCATSVRANTDDNDKKERTVKFEDLSPMDQAWLVEWNQIEQEMNVLIETLGGRFEHYVAEGNYTTDFYVYSNCPASRMDAHSTLRERSHEVGQDPMAADPFSAYAIPM